MKMEDIDMAALDKDLQKLRQRRSSAAGFAAIGDGSCRWIC